MRRKPGKQGEAYGLRKKLKLKNPRPHQIK